MFKVSPASLQTFTGTPNCVLEDRVQYSTVHIPNVFCDGHLQIVSSVGIVIVRCTETFWSPCTIQQCVVTLAKVLYFTSYVVTECVTCTERIFMLCTELHSTHYMGSHQGLGGKGASGASAPASGAQEVEK